MNEISKESYDRLYEILGKPDDYLNGEICSYQQLSRMDGYFLSSLDKDYLKDYFLIKDWVKFSFYQGGVFEKLFKNKFYQRIPLENIKLIWNAFNQNKKELQGESHQFFNEKRYHYIPKFAILLMQQSRHYTVEDFLPFLKELVNEIKDNKYSSERQLTQLIGNYITFNKILNEEVLQYLKEEQQLKEVDLFLVFYDWNISEIKTKEKLTLIMNLLFEKKPETTCKEIIQQTLEKNDFHVVKYIHENFNYIFVEDELEALFRKQKASYNKENTKYMIENFQPARLLGRAFSNVYSDYRYSSNSQFYKENIEYLKKKIAHDELSESMPINEEIPKLKI